MAQDGILALDVTFARAHAQMAQRQGPQQQSDNNNIRYTMPNQFQTCDVGAVAPRALPPTKDSFGLEYVVNLRLYDAPKVEILC
jgi:hypothetical protein